jgi:anthranilate synthase component II
MSTNKETTNILVFDNYDSFTYNLVHYIKGLGYKNVAVHRNDQIPLADIAAYDKILLSPGPGIPSEAGILHDVIRTYAPTKSIFGVCLGLQAIGEVFGGMLINLDKVYHGIATDIHVTVPADLTFEGLPATFKAGRYHSWAVATENFPSDLEITAVDEKNQIMALRHRTYDVRGVQFHPESILTEHGEQMVLNWLKH